jgi:hypothetical protein
MDLWVVIAAAIGAAWLFLGAVLGLAGGFAIIRAVEMGLEPKSRAYWLALVLLYPIILLRALVLAALQTCTGGAR